MSLLEKLRDTRKALLEHQVSPIETPWGSYWRIFISEEDMNTILKEVEVTPLVEDIKHKELIDNLRMFNYPKLLIPSIIYFPELEKYLAIHVANIGLCFKNIKAVCYGFALCLEENGDHNE